jgi:hypothetical protein
MSRPITGNLPRIVSLAAGVAAPLLRGAGMPVAAHADNSQPFITSAPALSAGGTATLELGSSRPA